MATAIPLIFDEVTAMAFKLEHFMKHIQLRAKAGWFVNRLEMFNKIGMIPGVGTAPEFIVVAEKKGFPAVEQQSLAHCLENMWLKATALDLGFQLCILPNVKFIVGQTLFGQALNGCAIGQSAEKLSSSIRPSS